MIVLDASAAVELLMNTRAGQLVSDEIESPLTSIHAPHLVDLEVAQVLRRYVASGTITAQRGGRALSELAQLDLARYPHEPLLSRIWALRPNLTAYDAAYVALAEALDATLLTRDSKLHNAPGHRARVKVITLMD